ncbi:MAG: DUF3806 domain-containing protein [Parahaliea sp.]
MTLLRFLLPVLASTLLIFSTSSCADEPRISEPGYLDRQYLNQQRRHLEDLTRINFGEGFNGERHHDLALLQRLLDQRIVTGNNTATLQGMGVIMGDLLAAELAMHWVIYEDKTGRSRALRYQLSNNYLFPMTMISRRREANNTTPIEAIYQKAYDIIAPLRPTLPFQ